MNYFPTYPVQANTCKDNSAPLSDMVGTCYRSARNMLPNFIAVNFYMRSDGGGVFDILDRMNGERLCGPCSTIVACQVRSSLLLLYRIPTIFLSGARRKVQKVGWGA